ncbi:MAG: hypothetical protein U9N36_00595 [Euryarchaeota archaeon]|nr:hypothetical protein [Euryarchaeota archaeon]
MTARHKADATYPIVAAASIIAKVQRDHTVETLWEEVGVMSGPKIETL